MTPDSAEQMSGSTVPQLVVIGASAGGIHALSTLVATLPDDFPAPVVIAQHLDPGRRSQLEEVLTASTTLPVRTVQGNEALSPGTIYVVPADRDVEVTDHHVSLRPNAVSRSRPSVNRLLSTAAEVYGEGLTAVILTGLGSDGAAGAVTVHAYGGMVVVQNPETAAYSGMPLAVPPEAIDVVADLEAIGSLLVELLTGTYAVPIKGENTELDAILNRLRERTGLDFGAYKRPTIERRLQRRMASLGIRSLTDYRRHLDRHPEELNRLEASFLIKVTKFFRDPELFTYLRDHVLPALLADAKERGELRIWSAGCATGEEAYSLAILLYDLLGGDIETISVRIFATDVSADAIDLARHGVYPFSSLEGLPAELVERHFVRLDGAYQVTKAIRGMVVFAAHDLGHRAPFPRIDLILCRNVLIYFTPDLQRRVLQRFAFSLRLGGYLALGKAETVSALPDYFTIERPPLRVYRRVGDAAPVQLDRALDGFRLDPGAIRPIARSPVAIPPHIPMPQQDGMPIDQLGVGVATADRQYHVRTMNSTARRLLGLRGPGIGEDLIHAVERSLATSLRTALDAALRDQVSTSVHHLVRDPVDDVGRDIAIVCKPLQSNEWRDGTDLVLIEVTDISESAARQRVLEGEIDRRQAEWMTERELLVSERDQLRQQADRAMSEMREVRAANDVMAAEQAKLRAEVEQLYIFAEEAQASSEEIETLNEELQATNEELETLNEELQATVEELQTTNDELHTRGRELETLASSLEDQRQDLAAERDRLGAVLAHMSDAVVVVVASEEIVLANAAYERFADSLAGAVPESAPGEPLPPDEWLLPRAARGETFTLSFTVVASTGERRWFEASGQPVQRDGTGWGVVVIRDITDRSLRRMQEQFIATAAHELRTPLTTLSGRLQLLSRHIRNADVSDVLRDHVRLALEQVRRLEKDVADLMDGARLQAGRLILEREPLDLVAVVEEAAELGRSLANGQDVVVELPAEPVQCQGDGRRLVRVLLNLIGNAVTHARGTDRIDVRLRRHDSAAVIEVQDYGHGIPQDAMPHLFTRFYQGSENASRYGLGLGLFIAREIVDGHGGTIEVRSTEGEGATFVVRLPLDEACGGGGDA